MTPDITPAALHRVPPLAYGEGSWVVTSPTGFVVELYEAASVCQALAHGWRAETIGTYLHRINAAIRAGRA